MKKKIRVLQLGSPSGLYGAERWIMALIKHLDTELIESWIGTIKDTPNTDAPLCLEADKLNFKTVSVEAFGKFNFSSAWKLRNLIINNEIDILHTHGYKTDLVGWLATIGLKCKTLSTPHGWTEKPDFKLGLYEKLDRFIFPFLDAVAPLSKGLFEPLSQRPSLRKKLHLIINGVDISEIEQSNDSSNQITALREQGAYVIGYIGRLTHGKGLNALLSAVAKHGESNWHIALIGEGEQEAELKTLAETLNISERVCFYGFRPDRIAMLKHFDVFVLPSHSEGIPRCLMEAMTAEVPIVATDIAGCRNLIDGETTGLLFDVDDEQGLASAINTIKNNPEKRSAIIKDAKDFIYKNYSANRMAKEYETLYANMLKD